MKNHTNSTKTTELANAIFKQNIDLSGVVTYPKYKLVEGGEIVSIELDQDKFNHMKIHHMSEEGILCDDLETFVKWEMFS